MTSPDPAAILAQINAAREQTYQNIALAQGILTQANAAASAAARDRAAIQAIAQQTVSVDTSVGTRVFAGDTMIYGDTGWRNITSTAILVPVSTGTEKILVRRMGNIVFWDADNFNPSEDFRGEFMEIPIGFSPGLTPFRSSGLYEMPGVIYTAGNKIMASTTAPAGLRRFYVNWVTEQGWPTELPGTPA